MQPTIGRIVIYKITEQQAAQANERRDAEQWAHGYQKGPNNKVFSGNRITAGDEVPLIVVRVWPHEYGTDVPGVNGQAFLDGNDSIWITSAAEGSEHGQWHWPERA